ncbi:MAG TPA: TolC family protein [Steroidobacteraceae bacterium]|jgi:hypothetical protein|nr:TolC family protein [Steroidobacteraceae bacterium]
MARPSHTLPALAAALWLAPAVALALPPLEQLEARLELSPAAQLAERAYESTRDALNAGRIGLGVSAFGNVGYEHNHGIIDPQSSWTYNQGMVGGGLSMPLLGSRLQLEQSLSDQQVQLAVLDARRQLQRREIVARLRKAYGDYWLAQRLTLLAQSYLQDELTFEHVAELRTRAGLLLDADRLELSSGFSLARRDEASGGADREVALGMMRELTGQDLDGGIAVRPMVPLACAALAASDAEWVDADPELTGLQKVVAVREDSPRDSALYPVQSSVQLGYQTLEDWPTGQHGSSAVLSLTFQVPLEYGTERRLLKRAAAAQLAQARLEYDMRRQELKAQRSELVGRANVLTQSSDFAATRLAAADAAVEERSLRAVSLGGDVAEQLQRARVQRYNAAKALAEADKALVYWYADWARFEAAPCEAPANVGPRPMLPESVTAGRAALLPAASFTPANVAPADAVSREAPGLKPDRALYLWHSADWLANTANTAGVGKFAEMHTAGIRRLLISLDAQQMQRALADPAPLVRAVRSTHEQGFSVELLLGDPTWIRPGGREQLLALIAGLKSVPFDGVHLDLEPAQLDPAPDKLPGLLVSLTRTLAAVSLASPWPVAMSTHPRDLDVQLPRMRLGNVQLERASFAQALRELKVSPTLMVYVANPERAVAIAEPLLQRYPQLSFSVALSLEKSLPREESLWAYPPDERRQRIERVERELASANFRGVTLELEDAWGDAAGLPELAAGE